MRHRHVLVVDMQGQCTQIGIMSIDLRIFYFDNKTWLAIISLIIIAIVNKCNNYSNKFL